MNKNSFMTQFFVLLLIAGIATLVAPMAVQAQIPMVEKVEIMDMPPAAQSGKSLYSFARQRLLGDWGVTANRENLIGGQTGSLLVEPGYSLKDSLEEGQAVKFFKVGDEIKFKVTFNIDMGVIGAPALRLNFDGERSNDPRAVYDARATAAAGGGKVLIFTYTVREGDECFGDRIGFPAGPGNMIQGVNSRNPLYFTNADYIHAASSMGLRFAPSNAVNPIEAFHEKINQFYWNGRAGGLAADGVSPGTLNPPSPIPPGSAYIHDGLNYLIDTIKANVRITGIIKPATHPNDLRTAAVDFSASGFTAESPNVDVTEGDDVTGPFDVEFLFFNYGTGGGNGVIADTTQGFDSGDIKITGPGVAADQAGWTVSTPVVIGLDHRDPGFPAKDDNAQVKHSAAFKVYKATITPPSIYDGDVMITVPAGATMDIAGNGNLASNTLTVSIISLGVPVKDTLTLPSVALPAEGFVVLAHEDATVSQTGLAKRFYSIANLPNLETFFTGNGGTLELIDKRVTTTVSKKVGPIITEIMWGTDLSNTGDVKSSQWIEIYNADAAEIQLSNYQLKVTPFSADPFDPDAKAVDTVGNLGDGRWNVPGQRGRSAPQAAVGNVAASPPVTLVSMRRKVDFTKAAADVNDGTLAGSWEASTAPALQIGANRIGSPGIVHVTQIESDDTTVIPYSPVIINEIGNNTGDANDWIELRNVSDAEVNLKKWELNVIVPDDDDATDKNDDPDEKSLVQFPDADLKLGAGQILLIVNTSPRNSPLARGKKFGDADGMTAVGAAQGQGGILSDAMFYDAKGGLDALPESGELLLVLRKAYDKRHSADEISDITGTLFFEKPSLSTHIWPLKATPVGHGNVVDGTEKPEDFRAGKVYKRNDAGGGTGEKDWGVVGYTGIGYDRSAANTDANGGTPGFPNDALMDKTSATGFSGAVTISEIMVNTNNGRLPQWIELRNSSQTQGINLNGWQLKIAHENDADADVDSRKSFDDVNSRKNVTISLPDKYYLPPNQTMLIATRSARKSDELTGNRVIVLWEVIAARHALEVQNSRFTMLSKEGFTLSLFEKGQNARSDAAVDTVTIREDMLTAAKIGEEGSERISLIRFHQNDSWQSAKNTAEITRIAADVYYGNTTDIGTPGWSPGDALPVSLSSFLPKRTDAGVVIKWTTQSELNNAGFNILRSATKTGAFVVINPTMIQGAGTTGEKHTYSYTDKTAKPNVVYYYQIEDVSFDGNRQRLTGAARLRGHIGAAGKLTTTWGDLKVQD